MPFSVQLGLLCAVLTALGSIVGFFLKHKGALKAPLVDARRPIHSTIQLFKSPIYTLGCVVATTSWGFHVAALALAPISVVQSVIAGGLVLVTVVADRFFGHHVTRREWIGVALTAAGLAFLAATLEGTTDEAHSNYDAWVFGVVLVGTTLAALILTARSGTNGPALAVSAGLLWAGSDITIKAVTGHSAVDVLSVAFRRRAAHFGIATNRGFAGTYDFATPTDVATLFPRFLENLPDNSIVMCHPGHVDDDLRQLDPLTEPRAREYHYLKSGAFAGELARRGFVLA